MRSAMLAFDGLDDDGRVTRLLLNLQHAFEMLLKIALVQDRQAVFDKKSGKSIGFDTCVNLAQPKAISLSPWERGTLRTIDAMRDEEQHW